MQKLTGGLLLSRNKDFLVFYRGNNFLSSDVTEALLERERLAKALQDEEEQARLRASKLVTPSVEMTERLGNAGTLGETLEADARWGKRLNDNDKQKMLKAAEVARHANLVRKLERRLAFVSYKNLGHCILIDVKVFILLTLLNSLNSSRLFGTVYGVSVNLNTLFNVQFSNDISRHPYPNHVSVVKSFELYFKIKLLAVIHIIMYFVSWNLYSWKYL